MSKLDLEMTRRDCADWSIDSGHLRNLLERACDEIENLRIRVQAAHGVESVAIAENVTLRARLEKAEAVCVQTERVIDMMRDLYPSIVHNEPYVKVQLQALKAWRSTVAEEKAALRGE